jgi:hypothetical protein
VIRISAKNKLGKTTTISRNVLARLPKITPPPAAQPGAPATIDGVSVVVNIKGAATALVVQADGKEIFRGTMLDGTSQTFGGTSKVIITTNNAGATNLVITNSVVVKKEISPVGRDGETKRNLEFDKDTTIQ